MLNNQPFIENKEAGTLARAIVDTVREPLLVLDQDLRVLAASRSFYLTFKVAHADTQGRLLYALGDGQWDIPNLRLLLEKIVPERGVMEGYEVEHQFPHIGKRTMLLNAREVFYEGNHHTTLLLGIEDVTKRRALEREREYLLRQKDALLGEKDVLLQELEHRVVQQPANHCGHYSDEIAIGGIRRDAPSSAGPAQPGHVGSSRAAAPPWLREGRSHRSGAVSHKALRKPDKLDDLQQSTDHAQCKQRTRQRYFP